MSRFFTERGNVYIPENDWFSENYRNLPYVFLGDDAFALKTFMTKPYAQSNLAIDKRII